MKPSAGRWASRHFVNYFFYVTTLHLHSGIGTHLIRFPLRFPIRERGTGRTHDTASDAASSDDFRGLNWTICLASPQPRLDLDLFLHLNAQYALGETLAIYSLTRAKLIIESWTIWWSCLMGTFISFAIKSIIYLWVFYINKRLIIVFKIIIEVKGNYNKDQRCKYPMETSY